MNRSFPSLKAITQKLLLLCCCLTAGKAVAQTNLYVDSSATASGAGTSWATAKKTLSEALTVANAGSGNYSIRIAKGTYYPTGVQLSINRDSAFTLSRGGIYLTGGYPSGGGALNSSSNVVVLSGNINSAIDYVDNSYHVLVIAGLPAAADTIKLQGLTISNGYGNASTSKSYHGITVYRNTGAGALIEADSNVFMIDSCTFSANGSSPGNGSGLYINDGRAYLDACKFTGNSANGGSGGALYLNQTITGLNHCSFSSNTNNGGTGGALYTIGSAGSAVTVANSSFDNNSGRLGGAICEFSGALTCTNITVSNDTSSGNGGGMYQNGGTSAFTGCTFANNTSNDGAGSSSIVSGGGAYLSGGNSSNLSNCSFTNNYTSGSGGGLSTYSDSLTLSNCAFAGNTGINGNGGMEAGNGFSTISHCTFTGNNGVQGTGGVSLSTQLAGSTFNDCVVSGNTGSYGGGMSVYYCPGSSINRCIVQGNKADNQGGGIYTITYSTTPTNATFSNCLVTGNRAMNGAGGGMYNYSSAPIVVNCTFAGDTAAGGQADGIGNTGYSSTGISSPVFTDCIIWEGDYSMVNAASTPVVTYCDVQKPSGVYTGAGNKNIDPLFVGPLSPSNAPVDGGNYTVSACSPVIDAGISAGSGTTDVAGNARFNGTVDMGAYEFQGAPGTLPAITGNNAVCAGSHIQLSNTAANGVWSSSNTNVATVSSAGVVSGVTAGSVTITYTAANSNGCTAAATLSVMVNAVPAAPVVTGNSFGCVSSSTQLNATGSGAWSSNNTGVATVDASGLITPVAPGTAGITLTITDGNGCSSADSITYTVGTTYNQTIADTICNGTVYQFGGQNLTASGTYNHVFSTVYGCDSTVTLALAVTVIDTTVTQSGAVLTASLTGATYQWVRCLGSSSTPIAGAIGQSYTATANGQYAVIISSGSCTYTSSCHAVAGLDIDNTALVAAIQLYPNPTNGLLTVTSADVVATSIRVLDISGRQLLHVTPAGNSTKLDMSGFAAGLYLVEVTVGDDKLVRRVTVAP